MTADDRHAIDRLDAYLDALAEGRPVPTRAVDPEWRAIDWRLRSLDQAPPPPEAFAAQLLEELMPAHALPNLRGLRSLPQSNGRVDQPWRQTPQSPPSSNRRVGWTPLAAAALVVLAVIGSLFTFGRLRPTGPDHRASLPAISTPAPTSPVAFVWQTEGGPDLPLDDPINPFIDPQGNLWVIDGKNSRFQIFGPDGTFLEVWGTPGSAEGQFDFVDPSVAGGFGQAGAAFDAEGNLYVADPGNHRIQKFGPDRDFISAWGSKGREDGQFLALLDLAVDGQGRVYTSDEVRNVVQVFDNAGRLLAVWGGHDADEGWLPSPAAIEVDADDNVWVNHFRQSRIQKFSPDGVLLATLGQMGTGTDEGELDNPSAVAVDDQGRVYVAEWGNNRVQVFDADGQFLATWGEIGPGEGQFSGLNSIALDGQGSVFTAEDSADRVQKFRLLPPLAPE
jgi:sugar lactone lactonase YvrE